MTDKVIFADQSKTKIDGVSKHVVRYESDAMVTCCSKTGGFDTHTYDEIIEGLGNGRVEVDHAYFGLSSAEARAKFETELVSNMPVSAQKKMFFMQAYCDAVIEMQARGELKRTETSIKASHDQIESETVLRFSTSGDGGNQKKYAGKLSFCERFELPSAGRGLKWVRKYEKMGKSPLAFVDKRYLSGRCGPQMTYDAQMLLNAGVLGYASYKRPSKVMTAKDTQRAFRKENVQRISDGRDPLVIPSQSTIIRAINELEPYHVMCERKGVDAANRHFAIVEEGVDVLRPMERIEIDEWKVDLITLFAKAGIFGRLSVEEINSLHYGRRWVYIVIDVRTRCVLGLKVAAEYSPVDAIAAMEMATRDKTELAQAFGCQKPWDQFGGVYGVSTDQGSAFISLEFKRAVVDLMGTVSFPPAGVPKLRGHVERFFNTFALELMPLLSARTFSNVVQKGDFEPEKIAALTDDQLAEVLIRFVVDVYHQKPHAGLNGQTPANCWAEQVEKVGRLAPPDRRHRLAALGQKYSRTVSGRGVRFCGIHYTNPELRDHFLKSNKRKIDIRVDRSDLGCIEVNLEGGWVPAKPLAKGFDGMSLEAWTHACQILRRKYKAEADINQSCIDQAIDDISELDRQACLRIGVTPQALTPEQVNQNRKKLFLGLNVIAGQVDTGKPKPRGLLGQRFAGGGRTASSPTPVIASDVDEPTPDFSRTPTWRLEDA